MVCSHVRLVCLLGAALVAPNIGFAQTGLPEKASTASAGGSAPTSSVPGWLSVSGQLRARAESYNNGGFRPDNSDQYLLTRVLLHARVQPSRFTSLSIAHEPHGRAGFLGEMRGQNAGVSRAELRAEPAAHVFGDHADLRQAYLQVGADKDPAMLRAGRVELAFGDGRLVGTLPWANTLRTFDGARGSVSGAGYRVDAFAASVVKVEQDKFDKNIPGNNFYGVYSAFTHLLPRASVEPFVFWRRQSGLTSELGVRSTMNFGTYGLRAAGKLPSNVDYDMQLALQNGSLGDESIRAWAEHWLVGFTVIEADAGERVTAAVVIKPRALEH